MKVHEWNITVAVLSEHAHLMCLKHKHKQVDLIQIQCGGMLTVQKKLFSLRCITQQLQSIISMAMALMNRNNLLCD